MVYNFNSGPSILPQPVLEKAAAAILDFEGSGLSLLEIGHRTPLFGGVLDRATGAVRQLMGLSDDHAVLFLHGGATTQFMQVPMNLLDEKGLGLYGVNGVWGEKAYKEASLFGPVQVVSDGRPLQHRAIPKIQELPPATYLHLTSNNTVEGTQIHQLPATAIPLVLDMSSDVFSRPFDYTACDLIYAGAQKNMGAAGVNLVVVKKDLLGKINRQVPTILDYQQHIAAGSLMNTPPVFAVYVSMLTLEWILSEGGLEEMGRRNQAKADLVYHTLDQLPIYEAPVAKEDRSQMNVVFFLKDPALEKPFLDLCKAEQMVGVKGYRTVGGIRVSLYNALPYSSAKAFTDLMTYFAQKNG